MRSTIKYGFKGVATMKFFVAVFLVLTTFSSGAVTLGQNPPRRTTQTSAPQSQQSSQESKSDTIKICQGVPMPDGYVVVAYMTSAACPHGAYLLRKQNNYESSLAINGDSRGTDPTSSVKPSSSAGNNSRSTSPSTGANSGLSKSTSNPSTGASSSQVASSVTRPRIVASSSKDPASSQTNGTASQPNPAAATKPLSADPNQSQDTNDSSVQEGPPSLIGGRSSRPQIGRASCRERV